MKIRLLELLGTALFLATLTVNGQSAPDILWQKQATNPYTMNQVAVSPNGQSVASKGSTGVQVWRVSDGAPTHALSPFGSSWVGTLAFSPNGGYLVAGDGNNNISLWQTTNWTLVSGMVTRQQGPPVVFTADSSMIALGSGTNIEIRTLPKYGLVRSWKAANVQISALAISPDGTKLASGSDYRNLDTTVKIWEVATGNLLQTIPTAQTYNVGCIAFSPDGTKFATGSGNLNFAGPMQLWRTADGALLKTFPETVSSIAFSPDGTRLLAAGTNIVMRRVSDGGLIVRYDDGYPTIQYTRYIAFAPDGQTFVRGRAFGEIFAARVPVALDPVVRNGQGLTLQWSGGAGTYQLQQKANLADAWEDVGGVITNLTVNVTNPSPTSFYRVIASP